ncbi:MAG: cytochrome c oxidase subunit 3 [Saprospiraceae bacterium]|jgi:cytochrome c oxidase subunit 3
MSKNSDYYIHPLYILITLVLGSISALFLGFSGAYIYSRIQNGQPPIEIPSLFYLNTLFLLSSSFCIHRANQTFKNDETYSYKNFLGLTLLLSLLFLVFQIIAWQQMINLNHSITSSTMSGYLYVLSGVHLMHLIGGMPFLAIFLYDALKQLNEPVRTILYLSDEDRRRKLRLISIYWHFLDALWLYLLLFFIVNLWIS